MPQEASTAFFRRSGGGRNYTAHQFTEKPESLGDR